MKTNFTTVLFVIITLVENVLSAMMLAEYTFVLIMPSRIPKVYTDLFYFISEMLGLTMCGALLAGLFSFLSFFWMKKNDVVSLSVLKLWMCISIVVNICLTLVIGLVGRTNL